MSLGVTSDQHIVDFVMTKIGLRNPFRLEVWHVASLCDGILCSIHVSMILETLTFCFMFAKVRFKRWLRVIG